MTDKEIFGEVLAALRKRLGLTQQDVADKIGVSKSAVYGFEKGRSFPVPGKLVKLARHFKVTVDYLLTGETPVFSGVPLQNGLSEDTTSNNSDVSEAPNPGLNPNLVGTGHTTEAGGMAVREFALKGEKPPVPPAPPEPTNTPVPVGTDLVKMVDYHHKSLQEHEQKLAQLLKAVTDLQRR
jgi:transcriptional regulator with XRE-family HTH domain